jgi:hypothetical protein
MSDKTETPVGEGASYRIIGKFVGGGWWQSNATFASEEEAWAYWRENPGVTPCEKVRVVENDI